MLGNKKTEVQNIEVGIRKRELSQKLNRLRKGEEVMLYENSKYKEMRNLMQEKEVRDFFYRLQVSLRTRNTVGGVIEVPGLVTDRIKELLTLYSGLYDEVQVIPIGTDGRVMISVGEAKAKWNNIVVTLEELQSSIDLIEMEDIRAGGYIPICDGVLAGRVISKSISLRIR